MSTEIKSTIITVIGTLVGVIIGLFGSWFFTNLETKKDVALVKVESLKKNESALREKAAVLFGELSNTISFLDINNEFEVKKAKEHLAKARRAAFEFSAYTPPELSFLALKLVEDINTAVTPVENENVLKEVIQLRGSSEKLIKEFYLRLDTLNNKVEETLNEL